MTALRRAWRRPLAAHAAALAVLLVLGAWISRPGTSYSSDEGAALLQARLLVEEGTWQYRHPLDAADPDDVLRPVPRADLGTEGLTLYGRHPLYPLLLAGPDRLDRTWGGAATSIAGCVAAAVLAGLLARRWSPDLDRVTLWVVGIGSPLLFDAWLVIAHTLAAATTAGAVLVAVRALERRAPGTSDRPAPTARGTIGPAAAVAALVAAGAMLRTEALFVGPALAVAVLVAARPWTRRPHGDRSAALRPAAVEVAVAVAAVVGSVAAWAIDRAALRALVGTPLPLPGIIETAPGFVSARWDGFFATWLDPGYLGTRSDDLLALGGLLLVGGAVAWRTGRPRLAAPLLVTAVVVQVAAFASPRLAVPGLVLTFPVLVVGMVQVRRDEVASAPQRLVVLVAGLVAAAVLATQYARGGGMEWGGRYFALVLPLVAPIAVAALARTIAAADTRDRSAVRAGALALVASSLVLAWAVVASHRHIHGSTQRLQDAVVEVAAVAGPVPPEDQPVVVSDNRLLPQLLHPVFDRVQWLAGTPEDLPAGIERLPDLGVTRIVVVSPDAAALVGEAEGWAVVGTPVEPTGTGLQVAVAERQG